jgi:hypothetical protein
MNRNSSSEIISTTASSKVEQQNVAALNNSNYKLMNSNDYGSSLKKNKESNVISYDPNADENEMALSKQRELSDWYYIKSSPKPKPPSPYERRKVKNIISHFTAYQKSATPLQPPLLQHNGSFDNHSSTDQINSIVDGSFVPLQKFRSNDYIEHNDIQEKSPSLQSYKCFSMKYSKHPSGKGGEMTKFGEMTSSSFEHVNVTGLYDNRFSENDIRNEDYVQSLRIAAAKMRPLPQVPLGSKQQINYLQVCTLISFKHFNLTVLLLVLLLVVVVLPRDFL